MSDFIGARGEAICFVLLTKFYPGRTLPFFKPQFLGDKYETLDFIVELVDGGDTTYFFFVQVKSTSQGYTQRANRLKVRLSQEDATRLASYPAPTYIVGIDEQNEMGYIISVDRVAPRRFSSIPTIYPIDQQNSQLLWNEVEEYWQRHVDNGIDFASRFLDE